MKLHSHYILGKSFPSAAVAFEQAVFHIQGKKAPDPTRLFRNPDI
jgi:hypothetical protein